MAEVMMRSFHPSFRNTTILLTRTVITERIMVVMVIHAVRLTTGPLLVADINGVLPNSV